MSKKSSKKKATNDTHPTGDNALYQYLLSEAGGEEVAKKRFAVGRFQGLDKGMTLRDALDQAGEEGWGEALESMTLAELRGPRAPSRPRVASGGAPRKPRADMGKVREEVVVVLKQAKAPLSSREVAKVIGDDSRRVARILSQLVADGNAAREGSKRNSVYTLL